MILTAVQFSEACLRAESMHPEAIIEAERILAAALSSSYDKGAESLVAAVVRAVRRLPQRVTSSDLDGLLAGVQQQVTEHLGAGVAAKAQPAINRAASIAYRYGRTFVPTPPESGARTWNTNDKNALDWLHRDTMYWVRQNDQRSVVTDGGDRKPLGRYIAETVRGGLEAGQSSGEIGKRLAFNLKDQVGDQTEAYWRGLATNAATRAAAFGMCEGFIIGDVTHYEIVSVRDDLTSDVCRELDGKVFEVGHLIAQRDALMAADTPEAVRSVSPWVRADDVAALHADGGTYALAAAGVAVPPFHFHCRTTIIMAAGGSVPDVTAPVPPLPAPKADADAVAAFVGRFDSGDPHLYSPIWDRAHKNGEHMGQYIGPDGLADGTEYRDPALRGLRLSTWPTRAPERGDLWWRPAPSPGGGDWVKESPATGAIRGDAYRDWLSRQVSIYRAHPELKQDVAAIVSQIQKSKRAGESRSAVDTLSRLAAAQKSGSVSNLEAWVRSVAKGKGEEPRNRINEGVAALSYLSDPDVEHVALGQDLGRVVAGNQKGDADLLVRRRDGTEHRAEMKTISGKLNNPGRFMMAAKESLAQAQKAENPNMPLDVVVIYRPPIEKHVFNLMEAEAELTPSLQVIAGDTRTPMFDMANERVSEMHVEKVDASVLRTLRVINPDGDLLSQIVVSVDPSGRPVGRRLRVAYAA